MIKNFLMLSLLFVLVFCSNNKLNGYQNYNIFTGYEMEE